MSFNVLITGCSYSAGSDQSGWNLTNQHKHYSKILENNNHWNINNKAIGGCSNREIALRTVENCISQSYDFCIIQWSSLHRFWAYESKNNIDNATQILPKVCGWGDLSAAATMSKVMVSNYANDYIALKHWFLDQITLQTYLKQNNINYVFVRGFDNYISAFEKICQFGFFNLISDIQVPNEVKKILNFDHNPDDYLYAKLMIILNAYKQVDKDNCIGYNTNTSTYGICANVYQDDLADDGIHPGENKNLFLANTIQSYCKRKGILT